jgi:hypothetical protein
MKLGMNITLDNANPDVDVVRLWDVGVHWGAIHTAPGVFNWDRLDRLVAFYSGKKIVYVVSGTPAWAAHNPHTTTAAPWLGPGSNSMPSKLTHFTAFMDALVTRYHGRIWCYEIGNEPQLAEFMDPAEWKAHGPNILAIMTVLAASSIKAIDPSAQIISASVLPRASSGGMRKAMKLLAAFKNHKVDNVVDGYAVHLYPRKAIKETFSMLIRDTQAAFVNSGLHHHPLWVTEALPALLEAGGAIGDLTGVYKTINQTSHSSFPIQEWMWYAYNRPDLKGITVTDEVIGILRGIM